MFRSLLQDHLQGSSLVLGAYHVFAALQRKRASHKLVAVYPSNDLLDSSLFS
jgi:hypothetical protein